MVLAGKHAGMTATGEENWRLVTYAENDQKLILAKKFRMALTISD
jgi:hypothetical protein